MWKKKLGSLIKFGCTKIWIWILKIHSLYKFCYKLHMSGCRCCRVLASVKCVVQVMSVGNIYPYIALQSTIVYTEVQWDAH